MSAQDETYYMERIERLSELGRMSDEIRRLDTKNAQARYDYETSVTRSKGPSKRALKRWEMWSARLKEAYEKSLAFSDEHKIARLKLPSSLRQSGDYE